MYECLVVRDDIEDSVDNRTRFVFLAREEAAQDLDARYKTSICVRAKVTPQGDALLCGTVLNGAIWSAAIVVRGSSGLLRGVRRSGSGQSGRRTAVRSWSTSVA
jgi:hypothetical protein